MVSFYCSQCNDTIKKKKAEVHLYKCRSAVLSCVDCGKEFRGNSYAAHTTCVSEAQKYEKPGTQFDLPKGDKKQLDWFKTVQNAILSKKGSPKCCELLQRLQDFPNTPRKQAKFMNFVMNSLHGFRTEHVEEAWVIISGCASEVQAKANGDAEPEKVEPQSTGNATNGEATDISEKKKKKKHSKVEQQEETTDQVSSVSCDADADERKRKKHKRKHEAQQAEDSPEQPLDSGQNCVVEAPEGLANGLDTIKKKKKKHSVDAATESSNIEEACVNGDEKKHKNGADNTICAAETSCNGSAAAAPDKAERKKKKKHSNGCTNEEEEAVMMNGVNSTNGNNGHAKELELDASVSAEEPRKHKKHKRHHTTEESPELPLTNGKKKKRRDTEIDESSRRTEDTEKETELNCVDGQLNGKKKKHKKRSESHVADNHHHSSSPNLTTSRC